MAASLLGMQMLGDNAKLKSLALEIRTQGAANVRLRQNEDLRIQIDKSIEDAQKAQNAAIITAAVDWIVATVEVVSGIAKMMVGNVPGGAMDLAAGCSGLVHAFAETIALMCDDDASKTWRELSDVAGRIQLGFEIAGMCVDIFSVGRGVMATRSIAKATETMMKKGASESLQAAVETGAKDVIKGCAEGIGKQVAQDVVVHVGRDVAAPLCEKLLVGTFGKEVASKIVKECAREVVEEALKDAIARIVTEAVEKATGQVVKSGAQFSGNALTKRVVQEIQLEVFGAVLKSSVKSTAHIAKHATSAVIRGADVAAQGWIAKERAELQKVVQQLAAESGFMQFLLDEFEKLKKRIHEDTSHLLDSTGKILTSAARRESKSGALLSSIAHNIA
ncbi:Secreted effector protein SseC [Burkholderia lata]|nr:Secreted effector protein SseC [Burkholderia lata]